MDLAPTLASPATAVVFDAQRLSEAQMQAIGRSRGSSSSRSASERTSERIPPFAAE